MPASSKAQQKFMGMVHALQKGELSPSDVSDKVKDAADQMKDSDAEDYASTKHTGKPEHVPKEVVRKLREIIRQIVKENPTNFLKKEDTAKRDYKAEYKKFQSSTKAKKYRAELNKYNRQKGTYGNGDGKDASHKGGKIAGFEKESTNRGRAEKSRLKKESFSKRCTVKEISNWLKTLEEFRYRKVRGVDARRVASFVNKGMNEEDLPISLQKKWEHRKYGREKHLANKYMEWAKNSINEGSSDWKKNFSWANKKQLKAIGMMIDIDDMGLRGILKNMRKNPKAFKQFVKDIARMPGMNESLNESAVSFWQDMFRPGPIPKKYITQLIKKKGELPSKKHIKSIYRSNGNPSSSELAKSWKQLTKEKYVRAASGMWRWNADFTAWESINYDNWVNEGFEKYHLGGLLDSKLKKRLERAIKIWGGKIDAVGDDYVKFRLSSFEVQKFPALLKKLDKNKNVWIGDKRKNNIYDRKQNIDKLNEGSTIPSAGAKAHVDDGPRYWWGDRGSYESHQDKIAGKLGWEVVDWIMNKNTKMWGDGDPKSADYPGKFDINLYKGKDVDPGGPTGAVSYAPTGMVGKKGGTKVFQVDNMAKGFSMWEDHIKFILKNLGWEILDYMGAEGVLMNTMPPEEHPDDTSHTRKSEKGKVTEAMTITSPAYSSSEAQKHVDRDVTIMSKFIGKASQQVIKTMMDGVKSGRYDAMDLQRGFQSGPAKRTHYGEMDFIQQLWRKVRDGFRRYSKDRKLR